MREVSKEEFRSSLRGKNVHPWIEGNFPYTSRFIFPNGHEHGRIVDSLPRHQGIPVSTYFLREA